MTAAQLLNTEWRTMYDRPKINYPSRHAVIARKDFINEHGVIYEGLVITNHTRNRWWLQLANQGWLRLYLSTTSRKKLADWLEAFGEPL